MTSATIIVAATLTNGIGIVQGVSSSLPWRLPKELAFFTRTTKNAPEGKRNAVIMGRRTWESIPPKFRPLKDRFNIVLSRNTSLDLGADVPKYASLNEAISSITKESKIHRTFIMGGAAVYKDAITGEDGFRANRIILTRVLSPAFEECNTFFHAFESDPSWARATSEEMDEWIGFEVPHGVQEERGVQYEYQMWISK